MTPQVFIGFMTHMVAAMEQQAEKHIRLFATEEASKDAVPGADGQPATIPARASVLRSKASALRTTCQYAQNIQSLVEVCTAPCNNSAVIPKWIRNLFQIGGIFALRHGWGQGWDKIVQKEGLIDAIKFNTTVVTIERSGFE